MAYKDRERAGKNKNGKNVECFASGRVRILEVGFWSSELRAQVQESPSAFEGGFRAAKVGDGDFKPSISSSPALLRLPAFRENMFKLRQRLISRRGSGRGGTSRPSVASPPSRCCRCLCHQVAKANPIQSSQFMDSNKHDSGYALLPGFGTAVFSFSSAQGNSNIKAHVSVLFLEESNEEIGEQPQTQVHQAESSRDAEGQSEGRPKPDVIPPPTQPASSSGKAKVDWGPPLEGMCWIYEEEPDE